MCINGQLDIKGGVYACIAAVQKKARRIANIYAEVVGPGAVGRAVKINAERAFCNQVHAEHIYIVSRRELAGNTGIQGQWIGGAWGVVVLGLDVGGRGGRGRQGQAVNPRVVLAAVRSGQAEVINASIQRTHIECDVFACDLTGHQVAVFIVQPTLEVSVFAVGRSVKVHLQIA